MFIDTNTRFSFINFTTKNIYYGFLLTCCLMNTTGGEKKTYPLPFTPQWKHFNSHIEEFDWLFPLFFSHNGGRRRRSSREGQRDERHTHKASSQTRTMRSAGKASMGYTNRCASLPPCSHFHGDTFTPGTAVTLKHNGLFFFIEAGGPFSTSRGRRESLNAGNRRHDGLSEQSVAMDLACMRLFSFPIEMQ